MDGWMDGWMDGEIRGCTVSPRRPRWLCPGLPSPGMGRQGWLRGPTGQFSARLPSSLPTLSRCCSDAGSRSRRGVAAGGAELPSDPLPSSSSPSSQPLHQGWDRPPLSHRCWEWGQGEPSFALKPCREAVPESHRRTGPAGVEGF